MKLDVEGMEVAVLTDLLLSGVYCRVFDYVFGETHYQFGFYPMTVNNVSLKNNKEGMAFFAQLQKAMQISDLCRAPFQEEDDEHYLHDGMELPLPRSEVN